MFRVMVFCALAGCFVAEAAEGVSYQHLSEKIVHAIGEDEDGHVPQVEQADGELRISYRARSYMVHGIDIMGRKSSDPKPATGPDYKGVLVSVQVVDGVYAGKWERPGVLREPYWSVYGGLVEQEGRYLTYNLDFGPSFGAKRLDAVKQAIHAWFDAQAEGR